MLNEGQHSPDTLHIDGELGLPFIPTTWGNKPLLPLPLDGPVNAERRQSM